MIDNMDYGPVYVLIFIILKSGEFDKTEQAFCLPKYRNLQDRMLENIIIHLERAFIENCNPLKFEALKCGYTGPFYSIKNGMSSAMINEYVYFDQDPEIEGYRRKRLGI